MGLFQLVYKSQAAENISYTDILHILREARASNSLRDITGVLVFREGTFLQLLEGEEAEIRELIKKIFEDDRHYHCKVLAEAATSDRIFPEYSMAYFDGDLSGKGNLEVDSILEIGRRGLTAQTQVLQGFRIFRDSEPQLNI